jgi:hypothetical protein
VFICSKLTHRLQISCREVENHVGFILRSHRATSDSGLSSVFSAVPVHVIDRPTSTLWKPVQPTSSSNSGTTLEGDAEHASKRQKLDKNKGALQSLQAVQDSYLQAMEVGKIPSSWLPRLESKPDNDQIRRRTPATSSNNTCVKLYST